METQLNTIKLKEYVSVWGTPHCIVCSFTNWSWGNAFRQLSSSYYIRSLALPADHSLKNELSRGWLHIAQRDRFHCNTTPFNQFQMLTTESLRWILWWNFCCRFQPYLGIWTYQIIISKFNINVRKMINFLSQKLLLMNTFIATSCNYCIFILMGLRC